MRLKELREERNLTQNDVATAINTTRTNIGRWEKGINEPSANFIMQLADFFEVSVDYLIGRVDDDIISYENKNVFTDKEKRLLKVFMQLDSVAQEKLIEDAESRANIVGKRM